eukprot:scaffold24773_cov18-Tisochrysis_lutea.AAC.3
MLCLGEETFLATPCNSVSFGQWQQCFCAQLDAEDLVFSLEALVDKFGPEISPYAGEMVKQLAAAFAKYSTESDNNDEDEDDQAGMAAYGCLRAINTLLESVAALGPALFPELEASLYPLICSLVRHDAGQGMRALRWICVGHACQARQACKPPVSAKHL